MKAARGHGPAGRLKVRHHRFLRNAAKPKRKNHAGSSANMRIANALRQSAGISRSAKRSHGRNGSSKDVDGNSRNRVPESASSPLVSAVRLRGFCNSCVLSIFRNLLSGFWMFLAVCGAVPGSGRAVLGRSPSV
jgi:hypothetical protein